MPPDFRSVSGEYLGIPLKTVLILLCVLKGSSNRLNGKNLG
jgi:hypothetical protein